MKHYKMGSLSLSLSLSLYLSLSLIHLPLFLSFPLLPPSFSLFHTPSTLFLSLTSQTIHTHTHTHTHTRRTHTKRNRSWHASTHIVCMHIQGKGLITHSHQILCKLVWFHSLTVNFVVWYGIMPIKCQKLFAFQETKHSTTRNRSLHCKESN